MLMGESLSYQEFIDSYPELSVDIVTFSRWHNLVKCIEGNICDPCLMGLYIAHYLELDRQREGDSYGGEATEVWSREEKIRLAQGSVDRSSLRATFYGNLILRRQEKKYFGGFVF